MEMGVVGQGLAFSGGVRTVPTNGTYTSCPGSVSRTKVFVHAVQKYLVHPVHAWSPSTYDSRMEVTSAPSDACAMRSASVMSA